LIIKLSGLPKRDASAEIANVHDFAPNRLIPRGKVNRCFDARALPWDGSPINLRRNPRIIRSQACLAGLEGPRHGLKSQSRSLANNRPASVTEPFDA
jgi:hypothetical protein